jgi:2-phospho-L-lactate/phosphoenolpyruvate guanylyltransferase
MCSLAHLGAFRCSTSRGDKIIDRTDPAPFTWTVVIPVKVLSRAKSRLAAWAGPRRAELALAVACDTVCVVLETFCVSGVVVVTSDAVAARELSLLGAVVVPEEAPYGQDVPRAADGGGPADGLNGALRAGATFARGRWPDAGIAALAADLPALRPEELDRALRSVRGPSFVPDAPGIGTTLYAVPPGGPFAPRFGGRSRERHARYGGTELKLDDVPGLRRDVDTPDDLRAAVGLGVGPRTAAVAADLFRCAQQDRSASA